MDKNYIDDLVSIITPVYNSERFVEETIKSVQDQTYTNWEMILVDDCSSDNSQQIIEELKKIDNRIKYIKLSQNLGVANARNVAISNSTGRYIAFLDSDDIWKKEKLDKQLNFMKKNDISFSFTSYDLIDEYSNNIGKVRRVPESIDYKTLLNKNIIGCLSVVIDRRFIKDIHFEDIRHEDYAMWLSILKKNKNANGMDEILASYRKSSNSISSNKIKSAIWTWNIYRKTENLNLFRSIICFCNYALRTVIS